MKLMRCPKCGTVITTAETYTENMMAEINRLNALAEKDAKYNKGRLRPVYLQQAKQMYKLMIGVIHTTAQMDEHTRQVENEKSVLCAYLLQNNVITPEKLHELEAIARQRVAEKNARDEIRLQQYYGEFESICKNAFKPSPTENAAIRNASKKTKGGTS